MGYNLTIGEAVLEVWPDDQSVKIGAEGATHPDAPNHDPFTANGNGRSPSYTTWHDFCRETGLEVLFYGGGWDREQRGYRSCPEGFHRETPLLASHPGAALLVRADLDLIRHAREKREIANGGKPPGFWEDEGIDNGKDPALARLVWLEFWTNWALENCRIPILENS